MQIVGIGRVIFWSGGSLWIGQAIAPSELHSHHAVQVSFGLTDYVQFRTTNEAPWISYSAVVIPPDLLHTFQAPGKTIAHLFCEPESAVGRGLLSRFGTQSIANMASGEIRTHIEAMRQALDAGDEDEELEQIALDTLFSLSGHVTENPVDQRVIQAIAYMKVRLAEPLTLQAVAGYVGLSAGRFRHLFVEETGISFRCYLLWARLNRALELGFSGTPWTEAAHATNFADSAHLSRTTRRMYGIAPSSVRQTSPIVNQQLTA
jgi:AraC-like DNA-binding protein